MPVRYTGIFRICMEEGEVYTARKSPPRALPGQTKKPTLPLPLLVGQLNLPSLKGCSTYATVSLPLPPSQTFNKELKKGDKRKTKEGKRETDRKKVKNKQRFNLNHFCNLGGKGFGELHTLTSPPHLKKNHPQYYF